MDRDIGSDDQRDPGPERDDRHQPIDLARAGNNVSADASPTRPAERPRTLPDQLIDRQAQPRRADELAGGVDRTRHLDRDRQINQTALETAREIGRFRMLAVDDLGRLKYGGNATAAARDMQSLGTHGFIQRRTIWAGHGQ